MIVYLACISERNSMMIESHHERIHGSERVNSKSPVNELIDKINEMGVE